MSIEKSERRTCGHPGCDKKLNSNNSTGYCFTHFYDSKKKAEAAAPEPKKARKPRAIAPKPEIAAQPVLEADPRYTLRLSERQIDGLLAGLSGLPVEKKLRVLEAALVATV